VLNWFHFQKLNTIVCGLSKLLARGNQKSTQLDQSDCTAGVLVSHSFHFT